MAKKPHQLPLPQHFNPSKVGEVWNIPYSQRLEEAQNWAKQHGVPPSASDNQKVSFISIDTQITFCIPGFEMYVGGHSGNAAVEDNIRLCEFVYRNINYITDISPTMDTHTAMQIFHPLFWINDKGEHPIPAQTIISEKDVEEGIWKVNPAVAKSIAGGNYLYLQKYALHYVKSLSQAGKYNLIIWPFHAMLGSIGHALVPSVEEAFFFHSVARNSQTGFEIKGGNPLTENYSVFRPEVLDDSEGRSIGQKNTRFIKKLFDYDMIIIAGQAKSHCVAWTIDDLLTEILAQDKSLVEKVYLLEDCTSPVVIPGVIDFTKDADEAFDRFSDAGMHVVKSVDAIESWQGNHPFK